MGGFIRDFLFFGFGPISILKRAISDVLRRSVVLIFIFVGRVLKLYEKLHFVGFVNASTMMSNYIMRCGLRVLFPFLTKKKKKKIAMFKNFEPDKNVTIYLFDQDFGVKFEISTMNGYPILRFN